MARDQWLRERLETIHNEFCSWPEWKQEAIKRENAVTEIAVPGPSPKEKAGKIVREEDR